MKAFVTYLKRQSPTPQLASNSNGLLELPSGKHWNPGHQFKFTGRTAEPEFSSVLQRLTKVFRGRHGN